VSGRTAAEARSILRGAGFQVSVTERDTDDPLEDGVVIGQRPSAGSDRREGSTVTIIVGRGPEDDGSNLPPPPDEGDE
jgi:serine/threonine-protein kinase